MLIYKNCIAIRSGIMPVHTLQVGKGNISVIHMNNLNQDCILSNAAKNGFVPVAIAYDTENNKYMLYSSNTGSVIAIIDETIKPLSILEMIKKYNLSLTEQEYKQLFDITD